MADDDVVPEVAPDAEWRVVNGVALPFSDEHGPAVIAGDVARCFSHTPTGALVAATQIGYRVVIAEDGRRVAREQTLAGGGQDILVAALDQRGWSEPEPGTLCQVAGFRVISYTPDEAVISIATRCPSSGALRLTESRLGWVAGDWRHAVEPDGSLSPTSSVVDSLDGMTIWGGI